MQTQDLLHSRRLFAQTTWRTLFTVALFASMLCAYGCSTVISHKTTSTNGASATSTVSSLATASASPNSATPVPTATANPGPPTLQAMLIRHTFATIPAYSVSTVDDIACPSGSVAVGGGLGKRITGITGSFQILLLQDAPVSASTWRAQIDNSYNPAPLTPEFDLECLTATGTTLTAQIVTQSLGTIAPYNSTPVENANCPAGAVASGGGFIGSYPGGSFTIMTNAPTPGNPGIWRAQAFNTGYGSSTLTFTLQIRCLSAPHLHQQIIQQVLGSNGQPYIEAQSQSPLTPITCPAGTVVSEGGIDSGYPHLIEQITHPTSTSTWEEQVDNYDAKEAYVQVNVACLSIG